VFPARRRERVVAESQVLRLLAHLRTTGVVSHETGRFVCRAGRVPGSQRLWRLWRLRSFGCWRASGRQGGPVSHKTDRFGFATTRSSRSGLQRGWGCGVSGPSAAGAPQDDREGPFLTRRAVLLAGGTCSRRGGESGWLRRLRFFGCWRASGRQGGPVSHETGRFVCRAGRVPGEAAREGGCGVSGPSAAGAPQDDRGSFLTRRAVLFVGRGVFPARSDCGGCGVSGPSAAGAPQDDSHSRAVTPARLKASSSAQV